MARLNYLMSLKEFNQSGSALSGLGESDDVGFLAFFENYLSDILDSLDKPVRSLAKRVLLGEARESDLYWFIIVVLILLT